MLYSALLISLRITAERRTRLQLQRPSSTYLRVNEQLGRQKEEIVKRGSLFLEDVPEVSNAFLR